MVALLHPGMEHLSSKQRGIYGKVGRSCSMGTAVNGRIKCWGAPVVFGPDLQIVGGKDSISKTESLSKESVKFTDSKEYALHSDIGPQLLFGRFLRAPNKRVCGPPQPPSKTGNEDRGDGSNKPIVVVKKFSDMPYHDKSNVIGGAIFMVSVFGLLTYLCVSWYRSGIDQRKKNEDGEDGRPEK